MPGIFNSPSPVRNINLPRVGGTPSQPMSMGQQPFSGLLGNQGQGAGPSAALIQQMLPALLQQMQTGGGIGSAMMGNRNGMVPTTPAPVQMQPPNQNMLVQNSMQNEEPMKQVNVNPSMFRKGMA